MICNLLENGISEDSFAAHFPLPYVVRALTPWEAGKLGLPPDVQQWEFMEPFAYVSDRFGRIDVPQGFITDFASIPMELQGCLTNDSPVILRGSGPHDWLYSRKGDLGNGRVLSFDDCNKVLVEAMWYCGATALQRLAVYDAVTIGGKAHWDGPGMVRAEDAEDAEKAKELSGFKEGLCSTGLGGS